MEAYGMDTTSFLIQMIFPSDEYYWNMLSVQFGPYIIWTLKLTELSENYIWQFS